MRTGRTNFRVDFDFAFVYAHNVGRWFLLHVYTSGVTNSHSQQRNPPH